MTDINYPQRWLREAQAITSPEGWRIEKTNELLKCQKGLDELYPSGPILKSVILTEIPSTFTLDVDGNGKYTLNYNYVDSDYLPSALQANATTTGSAVLNATVNSINKSIEIDVKNGVTDEEVSVILDIDSVKSAPAVTKLTKTVPVLTSVTIGTVPASVNLDDAGNGTFTFPFTFIDEKYEPVSTTCTTTVTGSGSASASVNKAAKTVTVTVSGVNRATTSKIDLEMNIDGVKSAKKSTNAVSPAYRIETVTLGTVPASLNLDDSGNGSFVVPYTFTENNYVQNNVTCASVVTGSGSATATVDKVAKNINVTVIGVARGTTSKVELELNIDNVKSPKKSTNAVSPAYRIESVTLGSIPANTTVNGADNTGSVEFSYSFVEPQYTQNNVVCNTTSTTAVLTPIVDKVAKTVTVSVSNATVEDEEISFEIEIDGVKSDIKKSLIKIVTA